MVPIPNVVVYKTLSLAPPDPVPTLLKTGPLSNKICARDARGKINKPRSAKKM
jgi:hypothetical protein